MMIVHPFPPVFDGDSHILILGSFPSVKSREQGFYYGHPQNRFWKVLAALYDDPIPSDIDEKKVFLASHHIALWDVIASCEITGSADSSIRDVQPNDIASLLAGSSVTRVFTNRKTADVLYRKYQIPRGAPNAVCLPSTSPANAAWSLPKLTEAWRVILS